MSDERQIDVEESPAVKEADRLVPYSRFQEWQRRRTARTLVPPDQPPANQAVVLPVATPTHDR